MCGSRRLRPAGGPAPAGTDTAPAHPPRRVRFHSVCGQHETGFTGDGDTEVRRALDSTAGFNFPAQFAESGARARHNPAGCYGRASGKPPAGGTWLRSVRPQYPNQHGSDTSLVSLIIVVRYPVFYGGGNAVNLPRVGAPINAELRCYVEVQAPNSYTRPPHSTDLPCYLEL
jgi:hypothetical protein